MEIEYDIGSVVKEIIEQEEAPYREYAEHQKQRLSYLRNLKYRPIEEQEAERQRIIKELKEWGFLDENGELSKNYRRGEDED